MAEKSVKAILNNRWVWGIFALIFAFGLWFSVAAKLETGTIRSFSVLFNIDTKDMAKTKELRPVKSEYPANVRIKGSRQVLGTLDKSKDLRVYADLSRVVAAGEYSLELYADSLRKDIEIVSISPKEMSVKFDKLITKVLEVKVNTSKLEAPKEYLLGTPQPKQENITIIGPELELGSISSCEVVLPENKPKGTSVLEGDVKLLREDKTEIKIEDDNDISGLPKSMEVTIPIFKEKEVPLRLGFTNYPQSFEPSSIKFELSQKTIKIGCDPEKYDSITEVFLGSIDVSKLTPDKNSKTFDMKTVLTSGMWNVDDIPEISVKMVSDDIETKVVSSRNIGLINKPANKQITILTKQLAGINLVGSQKSLKKLQGRNLFIVADLQDLPADASGKKQVPVSIDIPGVPDVWVTGSYEIHINIS
ncbi:CdaA regulatory protein CdaR [Clostridia bacterium]|nr:CdaA regulatory protein CdaR [Clostridia bacterium]